MNKYKLQPNYLCEVIIPKKIIKYYKNKIGGYLPKKIKIFAENITPNKKENTINVAYVLYTNSPLDTIFINVNDESIAKMLRWHKYNLLLTETILHELTHIAQFNHPNKLYMVYHTDTYRKQIKYNNRFDEIEASAIAYKAPFFNWSTTVVNNIIKAINKYKIRI